MVADVIAGILGLLAVLESAGLAALGWAFKRQVGHNDQVRAQLAAMDRNLAVIGVNNTAIVDLRRDLETIELRHNDLAMSYGTLAERLNGHVRWARDELRDLDHQVRDLHGRPGQRRPDQG